MEEIYLTITENQLEDLKKFAAAALTGILASEGGTESCYREYSATEAAERAVKMACQLMSEIERVPVYKK